LQVLLLKVGTPRLPGGSFWGFLLLLLLWLLLLGRDDAVAAVAVAGVCISWVKLLLQLLLLTAAGSGAAGLSQRRL
jgi:hypothetical protein